MCLGAGHNGLACAAYLARAGKSVLVLEARERVGGACTLHEVWPGHRISPCAYLAGLLHPLVIEELAMADYGFRWTPATAGMFVPFDDGSSIQLWDDDALCDAEIAKLAPGDLKGWRAFSDVKCRLRDALRPSGRERSLDRPRPQPATNSSAGWAMTTKLARCSSNGRWSNTWSISSQTTPPISLSGPGRHRHLRQPL